MLPGQVVQCVIRAGSAVCYLGSQCSVLSGQVVQRVTWAGSAPCVTWAGSRVGTAEKMASAQTDPRDHQTEELMHDIS